VIDILNDDAISLPRLAERLAARGVPLSRAILTRWAKSGKLDSVKVANRWYTTEAAFNVAVNARPGQAPAPGPTVAALRANAKLEAMGW
jgi:hypothetical protein